MILSLTLFAYADSSNTAISQKEVDYDTSRVIAVIKNEYSAKKMDYSVADFTSSLIKSITPLMYMNDSTKNTLSFNSEKFKDIKLS